jgi:hypothetical protein
MRSEARSHLEGGYATLANQGNPVLIAAYWDSPTVRITGPRIEREEQLAEVRPVPAQGGTGREGALYS